MPAPKPIRPAATTSPVVYTGATYRGDHVRRAIDNRGVVLRNVHNLWIGGLNDNHLRRLLHHFNLRTGLQVALCFGLRAQSLNRGHDVGLLIVIGLSQRGSPGEILRHVIEHRGKFREGLDTGIPGLLIHGLHQGAPGQTLVLLHPVIRYGDLIRECRRSKNLRHQRIRIECDWRDQCLEGSRSAEPVLWDSPYQVQKMEMESGIRTILETMTYK